MLWEVDIYPAEGQPDRAARSVAAGAADLGLAENLPITVATAYLIQGDLSREEVERLAAELLADPVVERAVVAEVGDAALTATPDGCSRLVHVLPKPGVMDPVAQSTLSAIEDFGLQAEAVRTLRKFWLGELPEDRFRLLLAKVLANDAIEQVIVGPLKFDRLEIGSEYRFELIQV